MDTYNNITYDIYEMCKNKRVKRYLDECIAQIVYDHKYKVWWYDGWEDYNRELPKYAHEWFKKFMLKHYKAKFFMLCGENI